MFTADKARAFEASNLDDEISELVHEAYPSSCAYYKVWWEDASDSRPMDVRAKAIAAALTIRGFKVTEMRDLDSFRFAEVHFSWDKE